MGPGVEIRAVEYCGGPSFPARPDSTQGYRVGTGTGKEGSVLCRGLVRAVQAVLGDRFQRYTGVVDV
jgi:hypothetical protein